MRFRTFAGVIFALVAIIVVSYLANLNSELLEGDFALSPTRATPLYVAIVVAFLLGFLPTVGVLLTQTLQRDLAERRTRRLNRQRKSLERGYRRAVDYRADGQWNKSLDALEKVLTERPEDFSTLLLHGEVLRRMGRGEEALEVHRRAAVLYPRSVAVLLELIEDYEAIGDDKVADELRDRVLRDFPGLGTGILRERRDRALEAEDWGEARRIQERISALVSGSSVNEADRAVGLGLTYQRAVEDLENDRYEEAEKAILSVLKEEPRFVPALLLRGEGAVLRGRPGEAIDLWKAGFLVTGSPVLLQRIEDHFIEREQPIEAIDTLHKIINASESSLLPRFFLGRLFYRLEMPEEALRTLEDLAEEISRSPAYHLLLARIRHRRGDLVAAAESYLKCVQEAGLSGVGYVCRACRQRYDDWRDRCEECGSWNSVELNFELEKFSPEDLGLRQAPVWSHYGPAD